MGFSLTINAQTISLPQSELKKILCKSWKMDFSASNGNHIPTPNYRDYSIVFYENYDYKVINNGIVEMGTWCYNTENKNIEISFKKRESTLRVYSISASELVIILKEHIQKNPLDYPKVFSHFSPK